LDRYNIIIVVIDRLIKYLYIIPTIETININKIVFLLFKYIFVNYNIPEKIISDRNKFFTNKI